MEIPKFKFRSEQTEEQRKLKYNLLLQKAKSLYFEDSNILKRRKSFIKREEADFKIFQVSRKNYMGKNKWV